MIQLDRLPRDRLLSFGVSITVVAALAIEVLRFTPAWVPNPGVVLLFIVMFAALRDGTTSGLVSAAIAVGYMLHYRLVGHGGPFPTPAALARSLIVLAIEFPVAAFLVGQLRGRLDQALEKERSLRLAAEHERSRSFAILESMTDGFVTFSKDWVIKHANERAAFILGVPRERLIGVNGFALFPHAFGSSIHQAIAASVATRTTLDFEDYHPPTQRWYKVRVYPTEEEFSVYFRDVTARRRAQEAIQFQSRLLDAIGQAVVATDLDGNIVYWNKAAESLFGYAADEVVSRVGIAVMHHAYSDVEDARLYGRIHAGVPWAGEAQLRSKSGKEFMAALSDTPIRHEDGTLIGMVRVITDLTKRLSIEEQQRFLAEAGIALSSSLDAEATINLVARLAVPALADCCMVDLVDEEGAIRRVEARHVDPRKQEIMREVTRRYPPDPRSSHPVVEAINTRKSRLMERLTDQTLRSIAIDARHLSLMRELGYHSGMVVPLIAQGRALGALSLLSAESKREYTRDDLTVAEELARRAASSLENARLYEAAMMASRAKSDFLAVMSHELRTPLTTIMGYTDLLLAGVPRQLDEAAQNYVTRVRTAAWHLLGIIEQILIYARIEVGRERLQPQRVSLRQVVTDSAAMIEPVASEKGIGFRVLEVPEVVIETDPTKLRQVLVNLLSNAVKFTDHGEVTLTTMTKGGLAMFEVRDTGIGIAPEHMDRIFDPFWQVDQSATRNVGGTGLGLSVVRRLARLLGGDVSVESNKGSGAVFTVQLPLNWGTELDAGAGLIAGYIPRREEA